LSRLLTFYRGDGTDDRGRRLDDILLWDDQALEAVHDYIQWLFPLDEHSAFNPDAPLVSPSDRDAFASEETLARNLRRSLVRMLEFYGFRLSNGDAGVIVERESTWQSRSRMWLHPHNHNYLRLTRILKSLTLLDQPMLARALGSALLEEYGRAPGLIGPTTADFWRRATRTASRPGATRL
jgi:hypothetical protein